MPRPSHILRPIRLHTYLPEDLRARLDLYLFSEVEGRVPTGAYTKFLSARVAEFFAREPTQCPHCGQDISK